MNTYDYIKDSITVPQAAERYGMKIGRGGMVCCPFHEDKHPSMKLNERYFYCFGCGAHGDVIDLTARLLGTTTKDTVQTLLNDFGLNLGSDPPASTTPKRPAIHQFRQDEMRCVSVLTEFLHLLQAWKSQYVPSSPDDPLDDHYVLACQLEEPIGYTLDILTVGELPERVRLVDDLAGTGKLDRLKQTMADMKENGERHEEARADG